MAAGQEPGVEEEKASVCYSVAGTFYYDVNGRYGLQSQAEFPPPEEHFFRYWYDESGQLQSSATNPGCIFTEGQGVYTEKTSPFYGCFSTYWGAGVNASVGNGEEAIMFTQFWVAPVDGEAVGMERLDFDLSFLEFPALGVLGFTVIIADNKSSPSLANYDFHFPAFSEREVSFKVEYLEGNARFGDVPYMTTYRQPVSSLTSSKTIIWDEGDGYAPLGPLLFYPEGTVPVGPVRLSVGMEGYTTDTVVTEIVWQHQTQARMLLEPDRHSQNPGPGPTDLGLPDVIEPPRWPYPVSADCVPTGALRETPREGWMAR
ncbi:MAG: hypothetical protein RLY93_06275 [Sumerlaeia bacterium]